MKIDYETPELTEAEYGKFVQGVSMPGGNDNYDSSTGGL